MPFQSRSFVIVFEDVMSPADVRFYEGLSLPEAPPLDQNYALSKIDKIPSVMFQHYKTLREVEQVVDSVLDTFTEAQFRSYYILQIATLATHRAGLSFQEGIQKLRRSGILRELLAPADSFNLEETFFVNYALTSAVENNIPIDYIARVYNFGTDFGIVYPLVRFGDWADDPANGVAQNVSENSATQNNTAQDDEDETDEGADGDEVYDADDEKHGHD
ncbi:hypothetical protein VNI00_019200 [Paramarasmius palmivorus]|uniref:Uncharacterized protein n=1 Tax=Paramarasmius palmivorus TaxID=297713 RepID=A0AAW0AQ74_9AGAR